MYANRITEMTPSWSPKYEYRIQVEFLPEFYERIFGAKPKLVEYWGSATVWYRRPDGERAGTSMEYQICQMIARYEMEQFSQPSKMEAIREHAAASNRSGRTSRGF